MPSAGVPIPSQHVEAHSSLDNPRRLGDCHHFLLLPLLKSPNKTTMKKLLGLITLVALSMGFSSCCSMFGGHSCTAGHRTETKQVLAGYDTVVREVYSDSKSGISETVEEKVPRYKTVTKKVRVACRQCTRYYCPKKDCCGTTGDRTLKLVTAQGPTGSPNIGLVPTMKPLAP